MRDQLNYFATVIRHLQHFGVVSNIGKFFILGDGTDAVDLFVGEL